MHQKTTVVGRNVAPLRDYVKTSVLNNYDNVHLKLVWLLTVTRHFVLLLSTSCVERGEEQSTPLTNGA